MNETSHREPGHASERNAPARPGHATPPAAPGGRASVFVYGWLLAAATAAIFLAAGPAQGSLGIFLVAAGVALTFLPARVHVEWPLWLAVGGLLAAGSASFLPARWFALPPWREGLTASAAIHLPTTVTPMPWETGFWLAVLGLSCLTGLFLLSHPMRSRAVLGLAAAAVLACGVYAALAIYAKQTGWHYPFASEVVPGFFPNFGFLPNRNHTATFLVTGSIVAMGVLTISLRDGRWILSLLVGASLTVCMAGLFFYSGSRGGIIFLVVGTLVWVGGLGGGHRSIPLNVSFVVLAIAAGVLFLVSGGEARSRLLGANGSVAASRLDSAGSSQPNSTDPLPGGDRDTPLGFRALIYRDTFDLIRDAPATGTGLGTFAPVFAQYRRASLSGAAALHPESDWLMLVAEAGVPALLFALAVAGLLAVRLRGASEHPYWPLRWGCAAASLAAVLHGIVDVPSHRVSLGWWILLLAGLGVPASRQSTGKSGAVQRTLFVLGGVGTLLLGIQLVRAEWFGGRPLPPFAADTAQATILATFNRGEHWAAMEQAQAAIQVSPMAAPLYYQLGVLALPFDDSDAEVDAAFKAQRILNPGWPSVPLRQGDAWAVLDPKRTATLWFEALDRQSRVNRAARVASGSDAEFYRHLVERGAKWPEVQKELVGAVDRGPEFLLAWLAGASDQMVREQLPELAGRTSLLTSLAPEQREKFLLQWYVKGDRAGLAAFVAANPAWKSSVWPMRLRELADTQQFESLVQAASEHYRVSLELPSQTGAPAEPTPSDDRMACFNAYWRAGNSAAARRALENPDLPASTLDDLKLKASVAAYDRDWVHAWANLEQYLRIAHPAEPIP